ncbi:MAG: FtsX-like permease family protein, partial [Bacilli bacterium]
KEIVVKNHNDESYLVSSSTVFSILTKIYEKHKGTVIEIIIKNRNENSTQIKHSFMRSGKPTILPFKIISKYAAILFKSKLWRNIFSILLLVLNIIMIFVYTNIAAYDYETATKNAGVCNNAFYAQPYIIETNSVTSETRAYFNGSHLHGTLKKFELDPLPLLIVNSDISGLQLSLVIIDKPVQFKNSIIEPPELDNVLVSSFVNSIPLKKNTIDIFCSLDGEFDFNYTLNVQDYFESNYDKNDMSAFLIDPGCQNSMKDKFTNNYAVAFISASTFSKIKNVANFHLNASNFFLYDAPIKKYASKSIRTKYKIFDNNNLIGGRAPINENEIVISNAFLKEFGALGGCNSISECLNKKFHYRDLANISNRDVYQSILNFHDITDTVTVVGVTDDKSSNVYTNPAFMESLFTLKNMYLSGFFIDISSQYNNMKEILDGNIYFDLYYLKPIFSMKDLVNSDLMILILVALIIVLVSTTTFLCITFVSNVKGKYKEIAILKSFGTSKRRISIIFFLLNFFIVGVSIIIGLAFGILSQYLMNLVFMSPKLFNINFQLIVLVPISFVVVIFISLIVTLFSTFLALHKVNKIDVALALKMF